MENFTGTWITDELVGSPLTQALIYCLHHGLHENIDEKLIKYLINSIPENRLFHDRGEGIRQSNLDNNVIYHIPVRGENWELCSPIELAIQIKRIDVAKQMVLAGADPICATVEINEQIIPLFLEFFEFGTNSYMSWLLHEYLLPDQISEFIERVLEKKDMIFSSYAKQEFKDGAGRHYAHAALTCGHAEMIMRFIERFPTDGEGHQMLTVKDSAERTALQIAAANGDLESVHILLNM